MTDDRAGRRTLDLREMAPAKAYFFLISSIVPRPIAWVSTIGSDGSTNLAPFSFFQGICASPPTLMVSIASRKRSGELKDTLRNVRDTGELVVNVVAEPLSQPMVGSSEERAYGESEIDVEGLSTFPAERVAAPCVAESPVNMECRLSKEVQIGGCAAVFAEIVLVHVREELLDERGTIDPDRLRPWARLGGSLYLPYSGSVRLR
jgi:flavin reductase (DIM6/NTAB) family NADH-FMN oxidoreductase RutF